MSLDLTYPEILQTIGDHVMKERTESRAFLGMKELALWANTSIGFLLHWQRFEPATVRSGSDRGATLADAASA